jgi:pyruvate,water dikinase
MKMLNNITKDDYLLVGGKGANLGEMIKAGLPVPDGFVVSTNGYNKFVEENKLDKKIHSLLIGVDAKNMEQLEKISKEIKNLFEAAIMPIEIEEEIKKAYQNLGLNQVAVAVRSSSTAEDLPGISFAGQYDSYLNIKGKEQVCKFVIKCWASLWNSRAISYRINQNIDSSQMGHAIVVQKLINSKIAGILFTANPINGRRDQILINSSWGLGEAIVGGDVTPDQYVVDKKSGSIIEETIAKKETMTIRKEIGIEHVKIASEKQNDITLNKTEIEELYYIAQKVEKYFGLPQDVEWAYIDNKFYLVQSRPITSLYPSPEVRNNKTGLRVYINVNNYSQAMKEPFTPMGQDIIKAMVNGLVTNYGKKNNQQDRLWWYHMIGGRIFIDITDFMRTEKSWDKFKREDNTDKDPTTTKALLQLVERNRDEIINPAEVINFKKMISFKLLKLLIVNGLRYCQGIISSKKARIKAVTLGERIINDLKEERKTLVTTEEKINYFKEKSSTLFTQGFGIVFYVAVSAKYIKKAKTIMLEHLDDISDLNDVEKSVPNSVTTEMGMEILQIAKLYDKRGKIPTTDDYEIKLFLEKYGHRSSIDMEVGVPVWKEEPQYVIDLISSYIYNQSYQESIDRFYQGKVDAENAIQRIKRKLEAKGQEKKAKIVEKLLRDFREMFGIREQSKFFVRQFLTIFREMLIEIGDELQKQGRISDKMDIFFVTMEDILSGQNLNKRVKTNKEQYHLDYKRVAPRLLTSTGECIYSPIIEAKEGAIIGIPVSPGVCEGRVVILEKPEEGNRLKKGDILVTVGTNPSWTPLFLKIGGLIMETGGPISHGSVVAREYGVPAVAGVAKATTILKDGQRVRIKGEEGTVEII